MMSRTATFLYLLLTGPGANAFDVSGWRESRTRSTPTTGSSSPEPATTTDRRSLLVGGFATAASLLCVPNPPRPAYAMPMVSTDEFRTILRDSAQAIKQVEFSGPKSEVVTVKLVDGTSFGLNDVVESSVDPRSPLKIQAMCRENLVATRFTNLEAALVGAPKKKKLYTNERVQVAAEKERARRERIDADEADRVAKQYAYDLEQQRTSP